MTGSLGFAPLTGRVYSAEHALGFNVMRLRHKDARKVVFISPPSRLRPGYHSSFFNDTATTEIYTLSLHDALPILRNMRQVLTQRRKDAKTRGKWSSFRLRRVYGLAIIHRPFA